MGLKDLLGAIVTFEDDEKSGSETVKKDEIKTEEVTIPIETFSTTVDLSNSPQLPKIPSINELYENNGFKIGQGIYIINTIKEQFSGSADSLAATKAINLTLQIGHNIDEMMTDATTRIELVKQNKEKFEKSLNEFITNISAEIPKLKTMLENAQAMKVGLDNLKNKTNKEFSDEIEKVEELQSYLKSFQDAQKEEEKANK